MADPLTNIDEYVENQEKKEPKRKKKIKFGIFIIFIILAIFSIRYFGLSEYFDQDMIQENLNEYGVLAPLAFMVFYAVATVIFFPGTPLTIASGALFGTALGTVYAIVGATIGASIAFIFARYFGHG
ncbi:MAG: TVP38/TMEM64 family protein, partial [Candidatus Nanoarchaeia archaeon]